MKLTACALIILANVIGGLSFVGLSRYGRSGEHGFGSAQNR